MKMNIPFIGHTGHIDNEIDLADSESLVNMNIDNIKPPQIAFCGGETELLATCGSFLLPCVV